MASLKRFVGYTRRDGKFCPPKEGARVEYIFHCKICGAVFFAQKQTAMYCSNRCRQKSYRQRAAFRRRAAKMAEWCRQQRLFSELDAF